jgi:hypothetical protein
MLDSIHQRGMLAVASTRVIASLAEIQGLENPDLYNTIEINAPSVTKNYSHILVYTHNNVIEVFLYI